MIYPLLFYGTDGNIFPGGFGLSGLDRVSYNDEHHSKGKGVVVKIKETFSLFCLLFRDDNTKRRVANDHSGMMVSCWYFVFYFLEASNSS
jgi:hypothetical protein